MLALVRLSDTHHITLTHLLLFLLLLLLLLLLFSGLFERHKLLFSFQMTIKIQEVEVSLNREELDFFIKGNISLEKSARRRPYDWVPEQGWEDIIKLMTINTEVFGSLADDIEKNEKTWKEVSTETVYISNTAISFPFMCSGLIWIHPRQHRFPVATPRDSLSYSSYCC